MKALEKDRDRRYRSAAELGQDLTRYLNNEPISAQPPSLRYQVTMFARKNRVVFRAGVAVVIALVIGLGAALGGMLWALQEGSRADLQARLANQARSQEAKQRGIAEARLKEAITLLEENDALRGSVRDAQLWRPGDEETQQAPSGRLSTYLSDVKRLHASGAPLGRVDMLTVHHSGIPLRSTDIDDAFAQISTIRDSHLKRGWFDIGYHILIDPAGRVWTGRPLLYQGAHVRNHNAHNIGVCVLGDYLNDPVPPAVDAALRQLLPALADTFGFAPNQILTHRDILPTADPGDEIARIVGMIREDLSSTRPPSEQ